MISVSIFNVIFWAIMAIAFSILYSKGKEFTKEFEEAIKIEGKTVLVHQTQDGPVVDDARLTLKPVFDATKSIFKLSEYATIISVIAAVITAIIGMIEIF